MYTHARLTIPLENGKDCTQMQSFAHFSVIFLHTHHISVTFAAVLKTKED